MNDFEQEYIEALANQQTEPESEVVKMEEKGYPKFQMSVFMNGNKDQQFVIRAETIEEFRRLKTELLTELGQAVLEKPYTAQPAQTGVNCAKCGAPANRKSGTSKNGKPYNAIFCSTDDRTHTVWL